MTLTAERARQLLEYDPATGLLRWRVNVGVKIKAGSLAGGKCKIERWYRVRVDGRLCLSHRVIWLMAYGTWPKHQIDHIDGDRGNNKLENLRDVNNVINGQNKRRPRRDCKSGYMGVNSRDGRYVARIGIGGKNKHIGTFATAKEAHAAYVKAKRQLHPGCTI